MLRYQYFLVAVLLVMLFVGGTALASGVLTFGDQGDDVVVLQQQLAALGYYGGAADGVFGSGTRQAVVQFQADHGLNPDGIVGSQTLAYLGQGGQQVSRGARSLVMTATAYSAYDAGNGSYTYGGNAVRHGIVAVDPSVIPLGTRLYIDGYGYAVADDIGSSIKGNRIDLAFNSHGEAVQFGRRPVTVYIVN